MWKSSSDTQNSTVISDSEGRSSEKEWEVDSVGRNEVLNLKHELEQIKSENEVLKADKEKIVKRIELMMVSKFRLCIIPHLLSNQVKFIVCVFLLLTMTYSMLISFACRNNRKKSSS